MNNVTSMYIYLDESGDLGFDWSKKSTTPYFIITLLVCYFLARFVIEKIKFPDTLQNVRLVVDRCKNTAEERKDFNTYLESQLQASIPNLEVMVDIFHEESHKNYELQAVDLFCWGVHRKVTYNDFKWFNIFKEKIRSFETYLGKG